MNKLTLLPPRLTYLFCAFVISGCSYLTPTPEIDLNTAVILNRAEQLARSVENRPYGHADEEPQWEALRDVASVRLKSGDRAGAEQLFNEVIKKVEGVEDVSDSLKEMQRKNEELNRGNPSVQGISKEERLRDLTDWKISAIIKIAELQCKAGEKIWGSKTFDRVVHLADQFPNDFSRYGRVDRLKRIVYLRKSAGDVEGARETLHKAIKNVEEFFQETGVTKEEAKVWLAVHFYRFQLDLNEPVDIAIVPQWINFAEEEDDEWIRAFFYRDIAMFQGRIGDWKGSLETIDKMILARGKAHLDDGRDVENYNLTDILKVAGSLYEGGKREEAEQTIEVAINRMKKLYKDEFKNVQPSVWQNIAELRVENEGIDGVLEAKKLVSNFSPGGWLPVVFLRVQLEAGDFDGAEKTLLQLSNIQYTVDVIKAYAEKGDFKRAIYWANKICCTAEQAYHAEQKAHALRAIAEAQTLKGEGKRALKWALEQPTVIEKTYALLGVAEGLSP